MLIATRNVNALVAPGFGRRTSDLGPQTLDLGAGHAILVVGGFLGMKPTLDSSLPASCSCLLDPNSRFLAPDSCHLAPDSWILTADFTGS